ncbi:hypothetical protein D3C85_1904770 [compost metagenome]
MAPLWLQALRKALSTPSLLRAMKTDWRPIMVVRKSFFSGIWLSWARYSQLPSKMCFISRSNRRGSVNISRLQR